MELIIVMFAGILMGRPEEEVSRSSSARACPAGHAGRCQGLVAIRLPARRHGGACGEAQGSTAALLIMEDISLPTRCEGSLGHGEDAVHEG